MKQSNLIDFKTKRKIVVHYIEDGDNIHLSFPYSEYLKNSIKGCEGSRWDPEHKVWVIKHPKLSERNANVLGYLSNGEFPDTIPNPFANLQIPIMPLPFRPLELTMEHQLEAMQHCLTRRRAGLGHDMGLGKTLDVIQLVNNLKFEDKGRQIPLDSRHFWCIAPNAPLKAWLYESNKWSLKANLKYITVHESKIERAMREAEFPPYFLIVDEASRFRNANAKRTKYLKELIRLMREHWHNPFVLLLTGTPAPKDPTNWHSLTELLYPGYLIERDANQLRSTLANMKPMENAAGTTFNKVISWKLDEVKRLEKRLAPIWHIRTKEQCLDLPPIVYSEFNHEPTPYLMSLVRTVIETTPRAATALIKCRQLSDGFIYNMEPETKEEFDNQLAGNKSFTEVDCPKYATLSDNLDDFKDSGETRYVVWAAFQASLDRCVKTCLNAGWHVIRVDGRGWRFFYSHVIMNERTDGKYDDMGEVERDIEHKKLQYVPSMAQFQDCDLDVPIVFVGNPDAGGQGLTLTRSKVADYVSNTFDAEYRQQSRDRINRIGGRGALIRDYFHLPTDRIVKQSLDFKRDLQSLSMGTLKDMLELEMANMVRSKQ